MTTLTEDSKRDWTSHGTHNDIQIGCLQRIAAATELMAKNHDQLIRDRDSAISSAEFWREKAWRLERSNIALRGVVTKLKRRAMVETEVGE